MGNEQFIDITIKARTSTIEAKIEKGCTFETKSKKFTVNDEGKLSIFDKNTKQTTISDTIQITDYQKQSFESVANNNDEKTGKLTLSIKDIKDALKMSQENLGKDMAKIIKGGYRVQNPRIFSEENKLSAYITNDNEKTSGIVAFQHKEVKPQETTPAEPVKKPEVQPAEKSETTPAIQAKGAFLGSGLFNNTNVTEHKPIVHTVKKDGDVIEDIVTLARMYQIDTYQIIAANPQLKAGKDYKVVYPKKRLSDIQSWLKPGQKINIPARYSVKNGSMKNINDVAKAANVTPEYVKFLMVQEPLVPNKPDLVAYDDAHPYKKLKKGDKVDGTLTVGYGHTSRVRGLPIKIGTTISQQEAMELLAEDIMKHKAMAIAYLGKSNFENAPKSLQVTLTDIAYNKGIWDGFLDDRYCEETKKIKKNLEKKHYVSALVHSRRMNTSYIGLQTRNVYKFIMGLTDFSERQRKNAMSSFESYYKSVRKKLIGLDKKYLENAWKDAKTGKTTDIKMRYGQ